jgi:hypothetical protein
MAHPRQVVDQLDLQRQDSLVRDRRRGSLPTLHTANHDRETCAAEHSEPSTPLLWVWVKPLYLALTHSSWPYHVISNGGP